MFDLQILIVSVRLGPDFIIKTIIFSSIIDASYRDGRGYGTRTGAVRRNGIQSVRSVVGR
jgi:hypothetical protein